MILKDTYTLSNGVKIPKLGLGTWMIENDVVAEAVTNAIELGYRHIDTAQAYQNEAGVGEAIRNSSIPREELFITSKVHAGFKSYETAKASIEQTLSVMGLEYIDMMIIHAPQPWEEWRADSKYYEENKQVWKALEDAYEAGLVKAIGVSNFLKEDLENLMGMKIKPMVNQILAHISNTPKDLIEFCNENDILVEAYSPIAHGEALKNESIKAIADKYEVSIPQLCIQYVIQLGTVALPKTATIAHMKQNADLDFEISQEDMKILQNVDVIENYGEFSFFPVYSMK